MLHNLSMLLAPENAAAYRGSQATLQKPPAIPPLAPVSSAGKARSLKFLARIAGNAIGFAGIMAACWLSLQLVQTYMS